MDNYVQNIKIEDIIPNEYQQYEENSKEITDLAASIRKYGIVEPLLLKSSNGKYEIILGDKRYKAAKILGLNTVPAIIKDIDDDIYQEYKEISKQNYKKNKFINPGPNPINNTNNVIKKNNKDTLKAQSSDSYSMNTIDNNMINNNRYERFQNSDIINLSELNKQEYERDEYIMNNNNFNNQGVQPQNMNIGPQQPTFGGRFFPSLEDEPTNMNMGGTNIIGQALQNAQPANTASTNPIDNNNLIDLTDTNAEKEPQINIQQSQNIAPPEMVQPEYTQPNLSTSQPTPSMNEFTPPQFNENVTVNSATPSAPTMTEPMPNMNIQQPAMPTEIVNNQANINNQIGTQPTLDPMASSMVNSQPIPDISNNDITTTPTQEIPQFDMSKSIEPITEPPQPIENPLNEVPVPTVEEPQPSFTSPIDSINSSNVGPGPMMSQPEPMIGQFDGTIPQQTQSIPEPLPAMETSMTQSLSEPSMEVPSIDSPQTFPQKEVQPVVDSIKSLATNLKSFGYNISIAEEDLPGSARITIEIEK